MKIFYTTLLIIVSIISNAQTPEKLLEKVNAEYTPEKIYIQFDKSNYLAGDAIWFKAYLLEGYMPATKSTVLAVEMFNDSGKLIDKKILPIVGSAAIGNFDLSKSLYEGIYTIRAYTRRAMNFGTDKFYTHPLHVFNPNLKKTIAPINRKFSLYFFPEGGNLIADVENVVAFKCTDQSGVPENIEGKIFDSKGKEVIIFKSVHNGMGKFVFIPKLGETYTSISTLQTNENLVKDLPIVKTEGVVLQIKRNETNIKFSVEMNSTNNDSQIPEYMLGVQENLVAFKVPLSYQGKKIIGSIPSQQLPTGILQITIFNKFNQPLAERLVFINSGDYIAKGSLLTDTINFKARSKNVFSLNFLDTLQGTYAVSVVTNDITSHDEEDIVSRFLLTDDIKGYVFNAKYYFEKNDMVHADNLDYIMLTNGWRRYTWNEILSNKFPSMSFKDPNYITLEALVNDPISNKPILNKPLSIYVKTSGKLFDVLSIDTDDKGEIKLPGLIFSDTAKMNFKNKEGKQGKVYVNFKSPPLKNIFFSPNVSIPNFSFYNPDEKTYRDIKTLFNSKKDINSYGITLDEIKVVARAKTEKELYEKKYTTGRLGGFANKELDFLTEPVKSAANILDYLKSRLNGVNITGGPIEYSINYRNTRSLMSGPIQMSVFLDEMQVRPSDVATLKVSDVAMVKVFSNSLSPDAGGSLAIYTKKDRSFAVNNILENTIEIQVEGFSADKEFFSPDYSLETSGDILSDERTTLYWNPYLNTNETKNKINFSFYNNDNAKKFKIVIEGIQEDGKLLHIEKIIE